MLTWSLLYGFEFRDILVRF